MITAQDKPAQSGDVALAGPDGERVSQLIDHSTARGVSLLYRLTRAALTRLGEHGVTPILNASSLFSPAELAELSQWTGAITGTGDLLGRVRVRERMQKATAAKGLHNFAEGQEQPFAMLPESVPILVPSEAVEYFARLLPRLGKDAGRWGEVMQRSAFTLAHATETSLLQKIQGLITDRLISGQEFRTAPADIEQILNDAGISPTNPQYAEMVWRTNAMDAYNVGVVHEMSEPEVKDFFPVWQYLGIKDGREGEDHLPHFRLYYPNSLTFHHIRGERVYNCRCTPNPIDKYQWADLLQRGATLSYA